MKSIRRFIIGKIRTFVRDSGPSQIEQWRAAVQGAVEIGTGTLIQGATLIARDKRVSVKIGAASDIHGDIVLVKSGAEFRVGARTHIGGGTVFGIASSVDIGNDVLISFGVLVMDHNSHSLKFEERKHDCTEWVQGRKDWTNVAIAPIAIKDKAWVGARAILLKGVTVGEGAVLGAGSVVTKSIPAWTVVAGNPARHVRELNRPDEPSGA